MEISVLMSAIASMISALEPMTAIGAAIAVFTGVGAGLGMGIAISKAVEGIARQPEAAKKIQSVLLLGLAFIETTAIYGVFISIMILVL